MRKPSDCAFHFAGQAGKQLFAVTSSPLALLPGFNHPMADLPIAACHQRINAANRRTVRGIEQFHDIATALRRINDSFGEFDLAMRTPLAPAFQVPRGSLGEEGRGGFQNAPA